MTATTIQRPSRHDHPADGADADNHLMSSLIREHRPVVMARALSLTGGDHAWAEDVVQETFIRAWHRRDRMTDKHGSVRAWLMRVAHNLAVNGHRSRRAHPVEAQDAELHLEPVRDCADQVHTAMLAEHALDRLEPRHRVVLEEIYLRDRTDADAARHLGLPLGTVKSRKFYALRQLRAAPPWPASAVAE